MNTRPTLNGRPFDWRYEPPVNRKLPMLDGRIYNPHALNVPLDEKQPRVNILTALIAREHKWNSAGPWNCDCVCCSAVRERLEISA